MLEDVNAGIAWVLQHAGAFGGDAARGVHLVGQSAGGQLGALALIAQVWGCGWRGGQEGEGRRRCKGRMRGMRQWVCQWWSGES